MNPAEPPPPHLRPEQALRALDLFSMSLWGGLQALTWFKLAQAGNLSGYTLSLAAISSWLMADMVSGVAHYLADNFGSPTTPFFGPAFIAPFREHHQSPLALLEHGFLERNGNNALISSSVICWVPFSDLDSVFSSFCAASLALLSLWSAATNQIHAWAHQPTAPRVVRILQRAGILLSRQHHALHHAPYDNLKSDEIKVTTSTAYCITSGFWDRLIMARAKKAGLSPTVTTQATARRGT